MTTPAVSVDLGWLWSFLGLGLVLLVFLLLANYLLNGGNGDDQ